MEKMTGIRAAQILGKGDYEYALPFYRERRPVLIDLVLRDEPAIIEEYQNILRDQKNLIAEVTIPHFNDGNGASLWFIASPLYNTRGRLSVQLSRSGKSLTANGPKRNCSARMRNSLLRMKN